MPGKARPISLFSIIAFTLVIATITPVAAQPADTLQIAADTQTQSLLSDAQALLATGQSSRAYQLLAPNEAALAGNAYYDYLLGVAALDSGLNSEAIFSLRRSLAVEPGFSGARMELARAYFESGNRELARPLFARLLTESPPPAVDAVISEYIRAIDARPPERRGRWNPYIELFSGYDSNANGSTASQDFLGFTLAPNNIKTASSFAEIAGGLDWSKPVSPRFAWLMNLKASHRANPDASFIDASVFNGIFGANWQRDQWFGRATLDAYWASRDGSYNESYAGLDLLVGRQFGDHWDITLGLRGGSLRYRTFLEVLDVNRTMYSLGTSYRFDNGARLSLQAIGGNDSERQQGSPYGNSKTGGRLSLSSPVGARALFYASLGSLKTDYDGLFFGGAREDTQQTALLQFEFRDVWTKGLMLVPRVRYINNDSDVDLYSYDRTELGLIIRWAPR